MDNYWVPTREPVLLAEIERDALNPKVPLATILRRCLTVRDVEGRTDLSDWAARELTGYLNYAEIPPYRIIQSPLMSDGTTLRLMQEVTGVVVSEAYLELIPGRVNDEVRIADGVDYLERRVRTAQRRRRKEIKLIPVEAEQFIQRLNTDMWTHHVVVSAVYWKVDTVRLASILEHIRTNLIRQASRMREARTSNDGGHPPNKPRKAFMWS